MAMLNITFKLPYYITFKLDLISFQNITYKNKKRCVLLRMRHLSNRGQNYEVQQ